MGDNDASEEPKKEKKKHKSKKNKDSDTKEGEEETEKSGHKKKHKKKKKKGSGDSDPESKEESSKTKEKEKDESDVEDIESDKEKEVNEVVEPDPGGDNQKEAGGEEQESKPQDKEIDKKDAKEKKNDNGKEVNEDSDDEEDNQKEPVKEEKKEKSKKKKDKKDAKAKKRDKRKKVDEDLGSDDEDDEEETEQKEKGPGKSKDKKEDKKDRKGKKSPKGKAITEDSGPGTEDDNDEEPEPQEEKKDYRRQSIEMGKELNEDEAVDELPDELLEMLKSRSSKGVDETEKQRGSGEVSDKYDNIYGDDEVFGDPTGRGNVTRTGSGGSTTSKTSEKSFRRFGSFDNGKKYDWIVDDLDDDDDDDEDVSPMYPMGKRKKPSDDFGGKKKEKKKYIADELDDDDDEDVSPMYPMGKRKKPSDDFGGKKKEKKKYIADELDDDDDEDVSPMYPMGKRKKPSDDFGGKKKEKKKYGEDRADVFDNDDEFNGKNRSRDTSKDKRKGRKSSESDYARKIRFDNENDEDGYGRQRRGSQDSRKGSQDSRRGSQDSRRGSQDSRRGSQDSRRGKGSKRESLRRRSIDIDAIDRSEEEAEFFNKLEELEEKERKRSDEMKNIVQNLGSVASGLNQNSILMFNLLHQQRQSDRGSVRAAGSIGISRVSYSKMVTVQVKVVFSRVTDIDTIGQQFAAEVHIQARWVENGLQGKSEKQLDEIPFTEIWDPKLAIINIVGGLEKDRLSVMVRYEEEEVHPVVTYMWCVKAVFMEVLELEHFPFDTQELSVILSSDRPMDEIDLVPDNNNISSVGTTAVKNAQEWKSFSHVDFTKDFRSTDNSNSTMHPVLIASAHVRRRLGFYMWNVFIIVFLILGLSLTILSIDPTGNDRLGVNMTLFLTCVAFKLVVKTTLPHISYLTYLDIYVVFTMMYLAAQAFENAIISHLARFKNREKVIMYDEIAQSILISLLVLFHAVFLVYIRLTAFSRRRQMTEKDHAHHLKAVELKNKSKKGHQNSQPPEEKKDSQMNDSHINGPDGFSQSNKTV